MNMVYDIVAIVRMGGLSGPRVLVAITKLKFEPIRCPLFPDWCFFYKIRIYCIQPVAFPHLQNAPGTRTLLTRTQL